MYSHHKKEFLILRLKKMSKYKEELSLAINIGEKAIEVTEKLKKEKITFSQKKDKTPVSVADLASQIYIIERIKNSFPQDQIIAEENNIDLLDDSMISKIKRVYQSLDIDIENLRENLIYRGKKSNRQWTIDPIDGTMGYKKGLFYAIGIGLMVNSIPKIAMIASPSINGKGNNIFKAEENRGAWSSKNGLSFKKITVSTQKSIRKSKLCRSLHFDLELTRMFIKTAHIEDTKGIDSMLKFCLVANGKFDIYLRPVKRSFMSWDIMPGDLLVREAGGEVTDFNGSTLEFKDDRVLLSNGGFIATNKYLHKKALNILKEHFKIEKDM